MIIHNTNYVDIADVDWDDDPEDYPNPLRTIELDNNQHLNIYQDDSPENPREWSNLGVMVCSHRRYTLGDEQTNSPEDWLSWSIYDYVSASKLEKIEDDIEALFAEFEEYNIILPLYLYDHSGITMNTTGFYDRWDSGQVGFIYVSKDAIRKEYNWKYLTANRINKIREYLKNEVNTYDQYLRGDVYGFQLVCDKCGKEIDSCWGFYGDNPETNGMNDHYQNQVCNCRKEDVK